MKLQEILEYLTTKVLDQSWTKPYVQFIVDWNDKAMNYNDMADEVLSDTFLKNCLARMVRWISALNQIKNDDQQNIVRGYPPLTYSQFLQLILSAAGTIDETWRRRSRSIHKMRTIQQAAIMPEETTSEPEEDSIVQYMINLAEQSRNHLPDALFSVLSPEDRRQWIGMTDAAKKVVVDALVGKQPTKTKRARRRVNMAETSATQGKG